MPAKKRIKTEYPGVYFVEGSSVTGRRERIYFIRYRKDGRVIEERAGGQFRNRMTASKAARMRASRIEGEPSNRERREREKALREREAGKWTVDRLWAEYLAGKPESRNRRKDETRYNRHVKPEFGAKEPHEILPLDIHRLRIRLSKTHSAQTIGHILSLLKRIINFGVNQGLCERLKFKITLPTVHNQKPEDLTPDQLATLLEVIERDPHPQAGRMMKMALLTGMRRGELFGLKWEDIDFERGFISLVDPKGGPDQRIPLNDPARALLDECERTGSPYVFPGKRGGQLRDISKTTRRIRNAAGLPKDFRPLHGLRHVYVSGLASSGQVDLYTLQKLLTHKNAAMTARYAHLRDEALKLASSLAGNLVQSVAKQWPSSKKRTENCPKNKTTPQTRRK